MNDDQKIVLEWLKGTVTAPEDFPIWGLGLLCDLVQQEDDTLIDSEEKVRDSFQNLTPNEEWEVLEEFANWNIEKG